MLTAKLQEYNKPYCIKSFQKKKENHEFPTP